MIHPVPSGGAIGECDAIADNDKPMTNTRIRKGPIFCRSISAGTSIVVANAG
jgi:hypothetical protein